MSMSKNSLVPRCPIPIEVKLYVYPLNKAGPLLKGISGRFVAHTAIVVFGYKFEFSENGVKVSEVSKEETPKEVILLGYTEKSLEELTGFIDVLRRTTFKSSTYDKSSNNCHRFSEELSLYLTGNKIPQMFSQMANDVKHGVLRTIILFVVAVIVAILAVLVYVWCKSGKRKREQEQEIRGLKEMRMAGAVQAGLLSKGCC